MLPRRLRSPVCIVLFFCIVLLLLPAAYRRCGRWPSASSPEGLWCGALAGAIVLFEMLLWLKKSQRGRWRSKRARVFFWSALSLSLLPPLAAGGMVLFGLFGAGPWWGTCLVVVLACAPVMAFAMLWWLPAKTWMLLHIWLGLLAIPLALIHSGLHFPGLFNTRALTVPGASAGELPTSVALLSVSGWTLALFLAVAASGVWGLLMQAWLPRRLLDELPDETVAAAGDEVMRHLAKEARSLVDALTAPPGPQPPGQAPGRAQPLTAGPLVRRLRDFFDEQISPYLERGDGSNSELRSARSAARLFAQLAAELPAHAAEHVRKLESFCESRRQLDRQRRLDRWLHAWQLVHIPLSWALVVLLLWHAVAALKLW